MKKSILLLTFSVWTLALCAQEAGEFTLRLDAGAAMIEDFDVGSTAFSYEPGIRFDVIPTYHLTKNVAFDFNSGVIWNPLDKILEGGNTVPIEGDQIEIPFLLEAHFRFPMENRLTPFVGGGGGGVYIYDVIDRVGSDRVDASGDDVYGAIQGVAGIEYEVNPNITLGVVYKYLHIFTEETGFLPTGPVSTDDTQIHSISLSFRLAY